LRQPVTIGSPAKELISRGRFCRLKQSCRQAASKAEELKTGERTMGKGNNSRKNDKKTMKPKQDKSKPAPKK
jgi:hypothetical protein